VFKTGSQGLGYYKDEPAVALAVSLGVRKAESYIVRLIQDTIVSVRLVSYVL
jgi:hypothetical protein